MDQYLRNKQLAFAHIFILQNLLQTAAEKIQKQITMKQWLLLVMIQECQEVPTLTNLGKMMGCSRQNVKGLAKALHKENFVSFEEGANNSLILSLTDQARTYNRLVSDSHKEVLDLLFSDFTKAEVQDLCDLQAKLAKGISAIEDWIQEGA